MNLARPCEPNDLYLIFDCEAENREVTLNDEFVEHAWVKPEHLQDYDLNEATRRTLLEKGILPTQQ